MQRIFLVGMCVAIVGCGELVDKSSAVQAAENAGWSEVKVIEQHGIAPTFYGCSKDDSVAFEIRGKNPAGKSADATVCCGLVFKSCTVRY